jgi:hypothetical protein
MGFCVVVDGGWWVMDEKGEVMGGLVGLIGAKGFGCVRLL